MGLCQSCLMKENTKSTQQKCISKDYQSQKEFDSDDDQDDRAEETTQIAIDQNQKSLGLEDFTFLKVLGRGSFGKVLLVKKNGEEALYAVKVLRKSVLDKKKSSHQALQERNIMSKTESPFVVNLHYAFQSASRLYLVMDYMAGGELFLLLKKKPKLKEEVVQFYAAELVIALDYLHSQNVIYRDLKPENILFDSKGHLVITDFGLSKLGYEKNQMQYSFCGTPEYVAPEILHQQGYNQCVDYYSLGAVIYEMLCGRPPHYSRNKKEMLNNRAEKPVDMKPEFSLAAQALLKGLLMKDPKYRLGSKGVQDIKKHSFFYGVDWKAMERRELKAPIIPKISNLEDTSNFSQMFTSQPVLETPETVQSKMFENYDGFSYNITN